jgi:Flp pilus assembly protein TadG
MNRFRPQSNFALARPHERGVTVILIAVAMIFMVLAIAAIAIDVGAMYTARAEAKHAADAAALAAAKVLANSGMTSETGATSAALQTNARALATSIAKSVAMQNEVGGRNLNASDTITVTFPNGSTNASFVIAPQVQVTVQRTDFPTFFAKAWGRSTVAVGATSVAEAVNPSDSASINGGNNVLIAPSCVKPWIIPNLHPTVASPFFNGTGAIFASGIVGTQLVISPRCNPANGVCPAPPTLLPTAASGGYYPASFTTPPANQEPAGCTLGCDYEENIAACSPQPITCGVSANATVDTTDSCGASYNASTSSATSCLIHNPPGPPGNDTIAIVGGGPPISQPMQFGAGANNSLVAAGKVAAGAQVSTSDSLATVPVFDQTVPGWRSTGSVNVIGFVQGFITAVDAAGSITMTVVNLSGCGDPSGAPVIGDGISPVPVHLIR